MNTKQALAVIAAAIFLVGCVSVAPGHDPVVVRAEQTQSLAFEAMDAFFMWEYLNRGTLPADVTKFADKLRTEGKDILLRSYVVVRAYKTNRTAENKLAVETIIVTLQTIQSQIKYYINIHN